MSLWIITKRRIKKSAAVILIGFFVFSVTFRLYPSYPHLPPPSLCTNTTVNRPHSIHTRNGVWQYMKDRTRTIIVHSAFFDERPIVKPETWIRILTVGHAEKTNVYCQVWYEGVSAPYVTAAVVLRTGRGHVIKGELHGQQMLSCLLQHSRPLPFHVSITTSPCEISTIYLPVQPTTLVDLPPNTSNDLEGFNNRRQRSPWQHEFGVCVAIAFGTVPVEVLVEWIELHRILGVTEFNIYDGNMHDMTKVFDYYTKKGVLRVIPMPPGVDDTSYDAIKLSSPASLNHCMLSNVYRYRFALIIDFDEFIIPRQQFSYHDMLAHIDKATGRNVSHHSYTARNTYFFRNVDGDETQPNLRTLRYRKRIPPFAPGQAPKSFVDPRLCLSVFNHYCYVLFPNTGPRYVVIPPDVALSHHYRECGFGWMKCKMMNLSLVQDDAAMVFKIPLKARVKQVMFDLESMQ